MPEIPDVPDVIRSRGMEVENNVADEEEDVTEEKVNQGNQVRIDNRSGRGRAKGGMSGNGPSARRQVVETGRRLRSSSSIGNKKMGRAQSKNQSSIYEYTVSRSSRARR